MALDRQRILGELGSVMQQLQSADCGCLGKLFGNSPQAATPMTGNPLPTCGGCRRACCHGHGYVQHRSPTRMNHQPATNMNYFPTDCSNSAQQPISGNMYGLGPQIVNMMKGDHSRPQNMVGQAQGQMQGSLNGPMVIDAPQSPHGKVGLTPFTPPALAQHGQFNPNMNQGDISGQMQNQFIPQTNTNVGNVGNMSPWPQQNANPNLAGHQMPQVNSWQQQSMTSNPAAPQMSTTQNSPHYESMAKFNKMFPGVKQGLGGDLGFDPMAIAIQMNPDNQLKSAMNTMNKIMDGNNGMDQMLNKIPTLQPGVAGNVINQSSSVNGTIQQNPTPDQVAQQNISQIANQQPTVPNTIPRQGQANQQYTYSNTYGQPVPQQNQQIYAAAVNQQPANQYGQQQITDFNATAPNMPVIQHEVTAEDHRLETLSPESTGYPNQAPVKQIMKEPIFPVDTSRNLIFMPTKEQKQNNYGYNTLGQPVEMLPAKMYHPPEPSLPQTLSPQPDPTKSRMDAARALKGTVSKTSLMGNKQVGKTPSRAQLQHIYNQYKGSQSYTEQNVRHPGEGTYSVGKLNVPQERKAPPVPVERIAGDTIVNNPPNNQNGVNKVEQIMGQIGDVPAAKPVGDTLPLKEAPAPKGKCRNGLQDMVFSSYPTSAAWTFHGHGRNDPSPQRFRHRHY